MVLLCLHGSEMLNPNMTQSDLSEQPEQVCSTRAKKHSDKHKHKVRAKYLSQSSSPEEDQSSAHNKRSTQPHRVPSELDQPQHDYREVAIADLPSQYAEEVEIFSHILDLPDPRETMPRSSTSVLSLVDQQGHRGLGQEALQLCSLSALVSKMLLINLSKTSWPLIYLREST